MPPALSDLGYTDAQIADIVAYVSGTNTFTGAPHVSRKALLEDKGLTEADIEKAEKALPGVFDVARRWRRGSSARRPSIGSASPPRTYDKPGFNLLAHCRRLTAAADRRAQRRGHRPDDHRGRAAPARTSTCRSSTAPTAAASSGKRFLEAMAHVRMMAAAQPFLSRRDQQDRQPAQRGDASRTSSDIYNEGWKLGLKAVALYRDGCKASQPLSSSSEKSDGQDDKQETKSRRQGHRHRDQARRPLTPPSRP